jgi:hypothetical protein
LQSYCWQDQGFLGNWMSGELQPILTLIKTYAASSFATHQECAP